MLYYILITILFISFISYFILTNYKIQKYLKAKKIKSFLLNSLIETVKGKYFKKAYFSSSHNLVLPGEYKGYTIKHKSNFSECYNCIKFKTQFARMELFFNLIKEGNQFIEVLNIRLFPYKYRIKSEGNVEKNYSRLNIFTNNKYLTELLEKDYVKDNLNWLIRYNGDILLISHNNLHFKAFLDPKRLSQERVMDMIKAIHNIATIIYRKDNIEY